ncbi:MAG: hypothetical protein ACKVTZ_23860 [Bacteroidia bacterium]
MKKITLSLFASLFCVSLSLQAQDEEIHQTFLYFDAGKINLVEEGKSALNCLAQEFKKEDTLEIEVFGHIERANEGILEKRAATISEYLRNEKSVMVKASHTHEGHPYLPKTAQNRKLLVMMRKTNDKEAKVLVADLNKNTIAGTQPNESSMSFTTETGVRVHIPTDAFSPQKIRDFDVEVLTYFNQCDVPDSITLKDDEGNCLTSRGMVFINIYDLEGRIVNPRLKSAIRVQVPTDKLDQDLFLHEARKNAKGTWIWEKMPNDLVITVGTRNYYNFEITKTGGYSINKVVPAYLCSIAETHNFQNGYILENKAFLNSNQDAAIYTTYSTYPSPFQVKKKGENLLIAGRLADPKNTYVVGIIIEKKKRAVNRNDDDLTPVNCKVYSLNKKLSDLKYDKSKSVYIIQREDFALSTETCEQLPTPCNILQLKSKPKKDK